MPRKPNTDALASSDTLVHLPVPGGEYPVSHVAARVMEWRQALRERIGKFNEAYQMPGIVLLGSELPPEYEGPLADSIERGSTGFTPFTMNLGTLAYTEDKKHYFILHRCAGERHGGRPSSAHR